ncbi:MAG: zeta toxin family protein [Bradyrhizobium sp.]
MGNPFLLMVAGPNGAGKTTLTRWLRGRGIDFGDYINPDDIAEKLEGTYDARVTEAQTMADSRREACIAEKRSFSFETVMSHPSKVDILLRAKEAGFFVQLFFVGTGDPQTNVDRVALRVAQGGHDVPEDRTVARWGRTMALLHQAISASDRARVFDNSSTALFFGGPRLVLGSDLRSDGQRATVEYPPIPGWVRHYVLDRGL